MDEVLVSVWYLQQRFPEELRPPRVAVERTSLTRLLSPSVRLARFLYTTVGGPWSWQSRLGWDDSDWRRTLDRPGTELWMSWHDGRPTGYAEVVGGEGVRGTTTRISYLGLLPGLCGRGLGGHLLTDVTRRAWTVHLRAPALPRVERVEVDTSETDSDHALPNYRARGYHVVREAKVERSVSGSDRRARLSGVARR